MKWWRQIWATIKALLNGDADIPDIVPAPDPVTPAPSPGTMLPKPATICDLGIAEKGTECTVPFGKDIRAIATTGGGRFQCFVGCDEWVRSLAYRDGTVTAAPEFRRNGTRYVCYGHRVPRSDGPLVPALAAKYAKTTRFYYWPTREGAQ